MQRPSAVLDINVIVSGLIVPNSKPSRLIKLWERRAFQIVTSTFLLRELEEVLKRPYFLKKYSLSETLIDDFITRLGHRSYVIYKVQSYDIPIRDPDDLIVLSTAIDGNADYLVTGDKDLLAIREEKLPHDLRITTVDEFLQRLKE